MQMLGSIDETDFPSLAERVESEQSSLTDFSGDGATTVAVVRLPRDTGIDEICDEWRPELGVPAYHLRRYWSYRSGFRTNSAVDNPTERAYKEARLDYHYDSHIRASDEAQATIDELVRRLESGEDITLVCFEQSDTACHGHRLKEIIEARLWADYSFGERDIPTL